ncbi:hypothetical protein BD410DRAFT_828905 [Rickenella mellea]|uniref:Uncharacterized protein n=1 Tax=Rickenella mellea TaxID=50990 RepID=A0A4Y7Q3F1_9AGAM|nr:hypothetical protein BD410DRAFT_828905 [Rickenella mellea]
MLAKVTSLIPVQILRRIFEWKHIKHINELPVELLVEIFLCCLPMRSFPRPSTREAPLLLGRICRVWRSVSLDTPQLWAQITLENSEWGWRPPVNAWNSENFQNFGIKEWLRRSGNTPLSFKIGNHSGDHIFSPSVILALQAEAHRWKAVSLETNCLCIYRILQVLRSPETTPMLTSLHLLTLIESKTFMPIPSAPKLSSFYLQLATDDIFLSGSRFHGLRELRISLCGSSSPQVYSLIFTQCQLLEILEIKSSPSFPLCHSATVLVKHALQHLRSFIFVGRGDHAQPELWILDLLDAPALNSLAISIWKNYRYGQVDEATHLSDFLMRCGGQLQRLMLTGDFLSHDDFIHSIRHTPILESLSIESIILSGDMTTLYPSLAQIDILVTKLSGDIFMIAVNTILSRWKYSGWKEDARTISPVTIRVPWYALSTVRTHPEVQKCIQQGLRVVQLPSTEESWWMPHVEPVDA